MPTYQFVRIKGYPRGAASKKDTLPSVLAEGRREPSHSRHVDAPSIEVTPVDAEWNSIREYQAWIETTMAGSVDLLNTRGGKIVERKIRSDAPALGTVIASLPSETKDTPRETISRFRQECIDWFKDYLEKVGMRLNYCVLHLDEKYPHLHLWFTPGREMLSRREWKMGKVTNPSLPEKENMRRSFFREIGNRYCDELEKPKEERRRRIPSRAVAAANRLPPGEPNSDGSIMGLPVAKESNSSDADHHSSITPGMIERSPFYIRTVRRMIEAALQQRQRIGDLTEEQIIRLFAERSGASEECCGGIIDNMLAERSKDTDNTTHRPTRSVLEDLRKFHESSSGSPSPAAGASDTRHTETTPGKSGSSPEGGKGTPTLDRLKAGRRLKRHNPPER